MLTLGKCFYDFLSTFFGIDQMLCLTQRAADGGYAPRFSAFFGALSFVRFEGESTLPPTAANAHRWAASPKGKNTSL